MSPEQPHTGRGGKSLPSPGMWEQPRDAGTGAGEPGGACEPRGCCVELSPSSISASLDGTDIVQRFSKMLIAMMHSPGAY